jgi:hypothetical protein
MEDKMKKFNIVQAQPVPNGTRWLQIGLMIEKEHGSQISRSIKLDVMPIPNTDGEIWLQAYERNEDNEVSQKG